MYTPIPIKRSMRYGNNYWEVYSPKLQRNVRLFSDLEYDNLVLIETNPLVKLFCEQPLRVRQVMNNEIVETIFDMWVLWTDGKEEFLEVKYASELIQGNAKSERSIRQTTAQKKWCEENGFLHSVRTDKEIRSNQIFLSNMKILIPYIRHHVVPDELDSFRVKQCLKRGRCTIREIEQSLSQIPAARIRESIFWMYYNGDIGANLDKIRIGQKMEVWNIDEKESN